MTDEDRSEELDAKDELIRNQAIVIDVLEGRLAEKEARLCQIAHLTR